MEEYGWFSAEGRLQNLRTTSNYSRVEVEGGWQKIAVEEKLGGDLFWQFGLQTGLSTGISTDVSDPYAKLEIISEYACLSRTVSLFTWRTGLNLSRLSTSTSQQLPS